MGSVIVVNWITLDGVYQAPGRAEEDTRDGFALGGWAAPYSDAAVQAAMGEVVGAGHAWLFGRRTYEDLLASWNEQGGPFKESLNNTPKYVASRNPDASLRWPNSTLLAADVTTQVAGLKSAGPDLIIMGSGQLITSLMAADLIDRYLLFVAPVVLGIGRGLCADAPHAPLKLRHATSTSTGVIITTYEPER